MDLKNLRTLVVLDCIFRNRKAFVNINKIFTLFQYIAE
jgi:hypothetical protein